MNATLTQTARKNKATHCGSCQICGCQQKLPGNALSKHGYTVQWGFFNGTCPGAHGLPFEISCNLIQGIIISVTDQRAQLVAEQAELRNPATSNMTWVHEYVGGKTRYAWRNVELSMVESKYVEGVISPFAYTGADKKEKRVNAYGPETANRYCRGNAADLAEACTYLNSLRADAMQKRIDELAKYIAWQTKRVADWKPGTLTPVE